MSFANYRDVDFVSAKEVSEEQLRIFYQHAFPQRAAYLANNWAWHYGGPSGVNLSFWPLLAVAPSGQILGHVGTIPSVLNERADKVPASWFVDFFVLPEARGSGLGSALIRRVMQASPLMMAVAVSKFSLPIFRKYGWREVPGTVRLSSIIQFNHFCPVESLSLRRLTSSVIDAPLNLIRSSTVSFLQKGKVTRQTVGIDNYTAKELLGFGVGRRIWDEELVEWRLKHSELGGRILLHSVGRESAISRVFHNKNRKELHVLSFGENASSSIFGYLLSWAICEKVSRIVILTGDQDIKDLARRYLFFSTPMTPFFYSEDKALVERVSRQPPNLQMIDSDLDMALPDKLVA
mgnify:CR=1 FL=1